MPSPKKFYTPPPKNKLIIEKRIVDGKMRKVETYNGKVARVYDEEGKLLEDRSGKLKIVSPTPPLEQRVLQEKKLDIPEEDKLQDTISQPINLTSSTMSNLGTSGTIGLQLVSDDDVAKHEDIDSLQTDASQSQCPECKSKNIDTLLHLENATRYKCRDCNETFAVNKIQTESPDEVPNTTEAPKIDEIQKLISGTISGTAPDISPNLDNFIKSSQDISNKLDIPKIESPEIPKNIIIKEIPKKVEVPKEVREMGVPGVPILNMENRIEKLIENKTKIDTPKIEDNKQQRNVAIEANTTIKAEQQKNQIEDKNIIKENKSMAEEILEEYKREQWAKKRDFEKNIEDMARVASENKGQISGISHQIEDVEGKIGHVEGKIGDVDNKIGNLQENFQEKFGSLQENLQEKLGNIKKPVSDVLGELCTGVDCIKNDVKKSQEYQQTYQQTLEKQLEKRFQELGDRLHKLEEPTYICDNCGQDDIRPLSSFCPNCGAPIHNWTDPETGNPISGWIPFWKRAKGTIE